MAEIKWLHGNQRIFFQNRSQSKIAIVQGMFVSKSSTCKMKNPIPLLSAYNALATDDTGIYAEICLKVIECMVLIMKVNYIITTISLLLCGGFNFIFSFVLSLHI